MSRLQADLLLLAAAVIWGLAFVFQKTAMDAVGPLTFIAARSWVAAIALAPVAYAEGRHAKGPIPAAFYHVTALAGLAFFLGAALQQFGLLTATVTNTGFLTALYVVIVPFITWVWTRERPRAIVWLAAALSLAGIWLLSGAALTTAAQGDLLVAACALFWAAHMVIASAAGRHGRPVLFTCLQFVVVGVLATIGTTAFETVSMSGLMAAWREIAYVGLLSSALTFTIMSIALRHVSPAESAILLSTENLFAALAAALLLGERLGWINWLGAALIVVATLVIQLAPSSAARPAPRPSMPKET